jgi:hypothetical protein
MFAGVPVPLAVTVLLELDPLPPHPVRQTITATAIRQITAALLLIESLLLRCRGAGRNAVAVVVGEAGAVVIIPVLNAQG